ncbi:MAG: ExbD/TolR family protein [Aeromonas sp.]
MITLTPAETPSASDNAMTPMIDVIFSLLAFMMLLINAPLASHALNLPSSEQAQTRAASSEPSVLTVTAQAWQLQTPAAAKAPVALDKTALRAALAALMLPDKMPSLVLAMDKDLPVQRLLDTFALLEQAGISATEIATATPADAARPASGLSHLGSVAP